MVVRHEAQLEGLTVDGARQVGGCFMPAATTITPTTTPRLLHAPQIVSVLAWADGHLLLSVAPFRVLRAVRMKEVVTVVAAHVHVLEAQGTLAVLVVEDTPVAIGIAVAIVAEARDLLLRRLLLACHMRVDIV